MIIPLALSYEFLRPLMSLKEETSVSFSAPIEPISEAPTTLIVNLKEGAEVAGELKIRVGVQTDAIVNKVAMFLDGENVTEQASTPYNFIFDTIGHQDGQAVLKFVAYTDDGKQVAKVIHIKVNNEVAKGASYHVDLGNKALLNGDYDLAIAEGRIATKAEKKNIPAKVLLAQANLLQKNYVKSQNFIEEVLAVDPNNANALDLAGSVGVHQSFNLFDTGKSDSDALTVLKSTLFFAVDNRRTLLQNRFDALPAPTVDTIHDYALAADRANRFSEAIQALDKQFSSDESQTKVANMLAYSQIRAGRYTDAMSTLNLLKKTKPDGFDGYSEAALAILQQQLGDTAQANKTMSDAILDDIGNIGVRTAQASLALQQNKSEALADMLNILEKDAGQTTEVNYLICALTNKTGHYNESRKAAEDALVAEPANFAMYVELGNQVVGSVIDTTNTADEKTKQYQIAQVFFETAVEAKPDSPEALTGLSIISALQNNVPDALKFAQAAVAAQPQYPAGQYALSMAYRLVKVPVDPSDANAAAAKAADIAAKAQAAVDMAGKLDPNALSGFSAPNPIRAWKYFSTGGRSATIAAP